ncbi:DUF1802 family protein [Nostoc sphaeroides CHAB 2801]|uniref:DUF1802 family protein n=1 Tax=Nostoc sphaeroides TaxID=446679 RepID=UPI000E54C960|nr:DUF1802 family protein [Nostoc sphaeroides]MCC5629926.1 DUF1802 family protein [Nostoc sphaeroides CHAB 2801]
MNESVLIYNALCLSAPDIEALIEGRMIAAMPRKLLNPGQKFALYPLDYSTNQLSIEQCYHPNFLPIAQNALTQLNSQGILLQPKQISLLKNEEQLKLSLLSHKTALIKAWARCEHCQILDKTKNLDILSQLTIWKPEVFEALLQKQPHIFLAYLRVYHLPQLCEVTANANIQEKLGKFVGLPNIGVSEANPVINDRTFTERKRQLEKLEPALHPELEELQSAIASLTISQPAAKQLDDDIKVFLGWSSDKLIKQPDANLTWINDIAKLGDRSIEKDEGKSNYQAGTDFEIIARRSLDFLGFKVEEDYKGGAGGLDLFCSQPYPLVCECKAGKSIPDRAVEELDRIGKRHLKENYLQAMRLIIGPGQPTKNLKESAQISQISIINVMTLQKLVELKVKYPGAINLVELKQYLEPGQIDYKIDEYIDKAEKEIKFRSQILTAVKELSEQDNETAKATHQSFIVTEIRVHYNATHNPRLNDEAVHDLLIELSSPLTGYLGRIKGSDWNSDRFYFLRDLPIN